MSGELMSAIVYTPTTDVVRHLVTFPRLRLGEPRHMTPGAFDRWLENVRREASAEERAEVERLDEWINAHAYDSKGFKI